MRTASYLLIALLGVAGCHSAASVQAPRGALTAREAPPAPLEATFEHKAGHVWVHGRWAWVNDGWTWQEGYHLPARVGFEYRNGTWERIDGKWVWSQGEWIAPRERQIFVPGHFDRRHDTLVWIRERWEPAHAGVWITGRWIERDGEREWSPAHWDGETPAVHKRIAVPRRCHWSWCNVGNVSGAATTAKAAATASR